MRSNRRTFLKSSAVVGALGVAGCNDIDIDEDALTTPSPSPTPEPSLGWTGRYLTETNLAWASHRNLSHEQYSARFEEYRDRGYIITDVGVNTDGSDPQYSMVWHDNVDGRGWAQWRNLTSDGYNEKWQEYTDDGYRPLTIEAYPMGGELRFAGIWIENKEEIDWWSRRNMTNESFKDHFEDRRDEGMRPIDLEVYDTSDGPRISSIWYENVDNVAWAHFRNMSREEYLDKSGDYWDDGYRTIDFESYEIGGTRLYGAIWEQPTHNLATAVRTNRSHIPYTNWWRRYSDEGYRLVNQEHYGDLYAGIWLENSDRYRYPKKDAIDDHVEHYRTDHQHYNEHLDVPGISVAIVKDGELLYRRGFGYANRDEGREAHGRTVYCAASISKAIGGTLAVRLEAKGQLQDGTPLEQELDLDANIRDYFDEVEVPRLFGTRTISLPSQHDYPIRYLFSHLACVPHYNTDPGFSNSDMGAGHETATEAAGPLWQSSLISGCEVGAEREYSTHAFTIAGAVLEKVTGRSITRLIEEEIQEPFGLRSTRSMFHGGSMTPDAQRAVPYSDSGSANDHVDNSWKVLGGGIESTAEDLAWFGWRVLDGQLVDDDVRDNRLWAPIDDEECQDWNGDPSPSTSNNSICHNGVGWAYGRRLNRDVWQHGGTSGEGFGTYLSVFPDEGLAIAMMSNMRWNDGRGDRWGLINDLAGEVL